MASLDNLTGARVYNAWGYSGVVTEDDGVKFGVLWADDLTGRVRYTDSLCIHPDDLDDEPQPQWFDNLVGKRVWHRYFGLSTVVRDDIDKDETLIVKYDNGSTGCVYAGSCSVLEDEPADECVTIPIVGATPEQKFKDAVYRQFKELQGTLLQKHADYGPLNISAAPGGPLNGLRVRMWDKLARINNLVESGADPQNESLADSFADLANYAAIGLLVLKGEWPA